MPSNPGVSVQGSGSAEIVVHPANYYEVPELRLAYDSKKSFSIDEAGGKLKKTKSNTPLEYVKSMQADLITLGYLKKAKDPKKGLNTGVFTPETKRAVTRFQRQARRVYRITRPADPKNVTPDEVKDVEPGAVFKGEVTGIVDQQTAKEILLWVGKGWVVPVGRFGLRVLNVPGVDPKRHKLRVDAADEWEDRVLAVAEAGGVLDAKKNGYGDTLRARQKSVAANKVGASSFSFHFCGRAVDIDQGYGGGRRYFIVHELVSDRTYWRLYCKTELQDGTQGERFEKGKVKHVTTLISLTKTDIPAGWYIDMTSIIEATGKFKRIPAQTGFDDSTKTDAKALQGRYNKTEWWHFQYIIDIQATFQDEMELIGVTEDELRSAGWAKDEELDHKPG